MLEQFFRERDLVSVSDKAALQSELAIIPLHLRGHAGGGIADPLAQRRKFLPPELGEPGVVRRETNRPAQVFPIAGITFFPLVAIPPAIC